MSFTIHCGIGFQYGPFDNYVGYGYVSSDLIAFQTKRGRMHELDRIEPGTATICLNNASGNYWPNKSTSVYYPNVIPLKRVKLYLTYDGTDYDLWEGLIDSYEPGWLGEAGKAPVMYLNCSDVMSAFSTLETEASFAEATSDQRITDILDVIGWGATPRNINAGTVMVQGENAPEGSETTNLVNLLHETDQAESGFMFIGKDGKFTFYGRDYLWGLSSEITFSDNVSDIVYAGAVPYVQPDFSFDSQYIYNDVRVNNRGSTIINEFFDVDSVSKYGNRSLDYHNMIYNDEFYAVTLAVYKLSRLSEPKMRIKSLKLRTSEHNVTGYEILPRAVQYDIPTRVTVKCAQAGINEDYYIQGIGYSYNAMGAEPGKFEVDLQLRSIERLKQFVADHTSTATATGLSANYTTIHNAATADSTPVMDGVEERIWNAENTPGTEEISRAVFYFDLAGISGTLKSAYLLYYLDARPGDGVHDDPVADFEVVIVSGDGVSQPLLDTDYHVLLGNTTSFGSTWNSDTTVSNYNTIEINAAGLAYITTKLGASCPLGLRIDADIASIATDDTWQNVSGLTGGAPPLLILIKE